MSGYLKFHEQEGDGLGNKMRIQSIWEAQNAEVRSQTPDLKELFSSKISGIKKWFATPFTQMQDGFEKLMVGW